MFFLLGFACLLSSPDVVLAAEYTLFARHPFDENYILSDTVPNSVEIQAANKLRIFTSRQELESTTFAIYNSGASALDNVEVTIPVLTNNNNQSFSQDNIEINVVKIIEKRLNRWDKNSLVPRPDPLIPYTQGWINDGEFDVPARTSKQWWITIKTNQNTQPGVYRGDIQIKPSGGLAKTIPLEVTVSPAILLTNPEKSVGFWYHPPPENIWNYKQGDLTTIENFRKALQADFSLMKKYGLQTISGRSYTYNGDTSYLDVFLEEVKRAGLGDQPMFFMCLGTQGNVELSREIDALRVKHGIPEFHLMVEDEAFQDKVEEEYPEGCTVICENDIQPCSPLCRKRRALRNSYNVIQKALPGAKILLSISFNRWYTKGSRTGWQDVLDEYGKPYTEYIQVHAYNANTDTFGMTYPNAPEIIRQHLEETGDIGYLYINRAYHVAQISPYDHRIDSGLFLWILPLRGNSPWAYQHLEGDAYTDADGSENRGDVLYAYPDKYDNGNPLPALRFVGMREGIDDTRYFYTLRQAIALSGNNQKKTQAQQLLDNIKTTATVYGRNYGDLVQQRISPQDLDQWQKQIAQLIVDLGQPPVLTATPTTEPECPNQALGNLNCDSAGLIDELDLAKLLASWEGNSSKNFLDILLSNWQVK